MVYIFKRMTLPDFVLIVLLVFSGLFCLYSIYDNNYDKKTVIVEISGKIYGIYDLKSDRTIDLNGPHSEVKIDIKNGYVFVSESGCPQKICKKMGKKNKVNDIIVCIPNHLIIRLEGEKKNNYEFITQ